MAQHITSNFKKLIIYFINKGYVVNQVEDYFYFTDRNGIVAFKITEVAYNEISNDWFEHIENEHR